MNRLSLIAITLLLNLLGIQSQQRFTVVIDPGHGGKDPGCVTSVVYEKKINLAVALILGDLIEKNHEDVRVVYTRKTDVFIPLNDRAEIANRNKADVFISIHTNFVRKTSVFGTETYTLGLAGSEENLEVAMRENSVISMEEDYLQKYEGFDPTSSESYIIFDFIQNKHMEQSVQLASEIQRSFVQINRGNRGVRQAGFLVLRKTSMPSVLIELGFLSNRTEQQYLVSKEGQSDLALSIYQAFSNYKKDVDRRSGIITTIVDDATSQYDYQTAYYDDTDYQPANPTSRNDNTSPISVNDNTAPIKEVEKSSESQDKLVYKVQILTSDKKLSVTDRRFKGYKDISFYVDKGVYKYTYGETSDYNAILKMYRAASKDFKGAFIIRTKNGIRIQ